MEVTKVGGAIGIPGLYVTEDPGAVDTNARFGSLSLRLGLGWAKSLSFATGQCPVMKYHRQLMNCILWDRVDIANSVNATVISLDQAPQGYHVKKITSSKLGDKTIFFFQKKKDFDKGAAKKFILDPHGMIH